MSKFAILNRALAASALVGIATVAYLLWARPYQLRLGATEEEVRRPMPGDELDPHPTFLATRAITIEGTPKDIWPWLLQMGYGQAGYYGYDLLENLGSPRGIRSADHILSEFQRFKVGDEVPIGPAARLVFYAIVPHQYLIWAGTTGKHPGGFTWSLYPVNERQTRLVSRIRWSYHPWTQPAALFLDLFTEFTDHLAVRKILKGVKGRVEGRIESLARTNTKFAMNVAVILIFLSAVVLILLCRLTWQRWLAGLAAGGAWLITWYAPMPLWSGTLLALLALWGLIWATPSAAVAATPEATVKHE